MYDRLVATLGSTGLSRTINGSDRIRVVPELRQVSERYEPEVWAHLMSNVRAGDVVADVGAHVGLYTVALAHRVGPHGKVLAFEPASQTVEVLKRQVALNQVSSTVELYEAVAGATDGEVGFSGDSSIESHVGRGELSDVRVRSVSLDSVLAGRQLDILKVDVEGYEEMVLRGGSQLLQDRARAPRIIYLEVHPYAWGPFGVTSESLTDFLSECGYSLCDLEGKPIGHMEHWGEVIARRKEGFPG